MSIETKTITWSDSYSVSYFGTVRAQIRVTYTDNYDMATNKSTITLTKIELNPSALIGSCVFRGSLKFNNTTVATWSGSSDQAYFGANTWTTVGHGSSYGSITINRNEDGTGSFTITPVAGYSSTYLAAIYIASRQKQVNGLNGGVGYVTVNYDVPFGIRTSTVGTQTITLTPQPRITQVACTGGNFGEEQTLTLTKYIAGAVHTITTSCAGVTETLMTQGSTYPTITWTPAVATYAPNITNSMSVTATITCQTYLNGSLIGTATTTCTLRLKAADVAPSVSIATADPTGNLTAYGRFVVGKSKIQVTLTPTLAYGATVATVSINANGATYNTSPATTDFIISASNTSISVSITDTRGQIATATATIEIYSYTPPQINAFSAHRCQQDGTDDNTGAYMKVSYDVTITALGNNNSKKLKVLYKQRSVSSYTEQSVALTTYSETGFVIIAVSTNSTYDVQLRLEDDFGYALMALILPTAYTRMNFGAGDDGGIAVGKVSEFNKTFELAEGWTITIAGLEIRPVLTPSAAFAIPAPGNSVSYDMDGLTEEHELVRWNFSVSAENDPPASLTWTTYDGYFTITNNGGTTAETMCPVFVFPAALAITSH